MLDAGYKEIMLYGNIQGDESYCDAKKTPIEDIRTELKIAKEKSQLYSRIMKIQKGFSLNDCETYLIFLACLEQYDSRFMELFKSHSKNPQGMTLILAKDMFEKNYDKDFRIRRNILSRFFFQDLDSFVLQSYVFSFVCGTFQEEPLDVKIPELYPNLKDKVSRLKNMDGHFYFQGNDGIGRKTCFLALLKSRNLKGIFVNEKQNFHSAIFYAICKEFAVCVTLENSYDELKHYLPYIKFAVLIGENLNPQNMFKIIFEPLDIQTRIFFWQRECNKYFIEIDISKLASQYVLTVGEIELICEKALKMSQYSGDEANCSRIHKELIYKSIHETLEGKIHDSRYDKQINFTFKDVVLPRRQMRKIEEALGQVRMKHRVTEEFGLGTTMAYGKGISVLLVGPPGTGKTMSAYAFASELDSTIHKVELSTVVSKYVGETEKNLKKVFQQARLTQAVLFFDEADILFSKRTEVKDSSDKYNNMEVAFLLQEIENYEGVTLLATNFMQNIDEAFKRRIKFIIEFPFPSKVERLALLKASIPATLPVDGDLDLEFIADNFELSGGNIKNIIFGAACLAASKDVPLGMTELIRGVFLEYEKMGKQLNKNDFGIYESLVEG